MVERRQTSAPPQRQSMAASYACSSMFFALAAVALATCALQSQAQQTSPFANLASLEELEQVCQGTMPAKVVIDRYGRPGTASAKPPVADTLVEQPVLAFFLSILPCKPHVHPNGYIQGRGLP